MPGPLTEVLKDGVRQGHALWSDSQKEQGKEASLFSAAGGYVQRWQMSTEGAAGQGLGSLHVICSLKAKAGPGRTL